MARLLDLLVSELLEDEDAIRQLREALGLLSKPDRLMDLRTAANYVGLSEDALDRRARAGLVPSRQEAARCKRFFLASELDTYMRGLAPNLRRAA